MSTLENTQKKPPFSLGESGIAEFLIIVGGAFAFKEMYYNPVKMTQYQFAEFMSLYLMPGYMCFGTWKTIDYWNSLNITLLTPKEKSPVAVEQTSNVTDVEHLTGLSETSADDILV